MKPTAREHLDGANRAGHSLSRSIERGEDQIEEMSLLAGQKIGELGAKIAESTTGYVEGGAQFVKANPGKSIAYATVVGALVGSLLTIAARRK